MERAGAPQPGDVVSVVSPARRARYAGRPWTFARASAYLFLLLVAAAWGYIFLQGDSGFADLGRAKTWENAGRFAGQLLGRDSGAVPAFLDPGQWWATGKLAYHTLAMSVLAMVIAGAGAFLTFLPAARNVSSGELGGRPSLAGPACTTCCAFSTTSPGPCRNWSGPC